MNNRRKTDPPETSRDPVQRLLLFLWIGFALVGAGLWVHIGNWIAVWWILETFPSLEEVRNTAGYWLGNQLLVYGIVLLAIVVAITSGIVVGEKKRFEREAARLREASRRLDAMAMAGTQSDRDRWNTLGWNTNDGTEPPAIGGKRDS